MAKTLRFGACLPTFASCADRFVLSGYGGPTELEEMFAEAGRVEDMQGIELVSGWHLNENNFSQVRRMLNDAGLQVSMMVPDLWTQAKWGKGSFASQDGMIRRDAIAEVKQVMDMAAEVGCDKVDLWFGQDGNDYAFQLDYQEAWSQLVEGTRECASHRDDIKVCIEYKPWEPRKRLLIGTAAETLLLINEVDSPNVGILLDVGHALAARENVAKSLALIGKEKLFYVHFNDNYRAWDDDMMVGSVHLVEYLEILYWLEKIGYDDWYTLDIFPFREDGVRAASESIAWLKGLRQVIEEIGADRIEEVIQSGDATRASAMLREVLLPVGLQDRHRPQAIGG